MAKRFGDMFAKLRGSLENNLKNGELLNKKAEIISQIDLLKSKMPTINDGLDAMKNLPKKIPEFKIQTSFKDAMSRYEKFTGVDEVLLLQRTVVEAQDKFIHAQDLRREAGAKLLSMQRRLKEIHDEMQNTPKGDEKYLRLVTDEHKTIIEEQHLRKDFGTIEREEREHFNTMSAAVKLSHERERAHADRNKYWYIVASLIGTAFGVLGSTVNNRIKMAEFRELLTQQGDRGVLPVSGTGGARGPVVSSIDVVKQQQQLKDLEMRIAAISTNQGTIMDHIRTTDKYIANQFMETKRLIVQATATSVKSDKALKEAIAASAYVPSEFAPEPLPPKTLWSDIDKEALKLTAFVGFVSLLLFGIIGKMS